MFLGKSSFWWWLRGHFTFCQPQMPVTRPRWPSPTCACSHWWWKTGHTQCTYKASRQSAPACGGPGSWLSSATSRRCCMNGLPLQCPCCAAESNHHSGHFGGSKLGNANLDIIKPVKLLIYFFCFILNILPNVKIYQEHRKICILYNFLLPPCLFWNVLLRGWESWNLWRSFSKTYVG